MKKCCTCECTSVKHEPKNDKSVYSMGHKKVPVPFTWNGISTVLCIAFLRVYNFRTSNFYAFDVRTYWKV